MLKQNKNFFRAIFDDVDVCPKYIVIVFVLCEVVMNLAANKSVDFPISFLTLDCGTICSGVVFLCMDVLTKLHGPKKAFNITIFAILCSLSVSVLFLIVALIPGHWGESIGIAESSIVNNAINNTFKGNWYVISGSTIAFVISSYINNVLNAFIGVEIKDDSLSFSKFAIRSYVSTFISQIIDNLLFCTLVTHFLFKWNMMQCISCSILTSLIELLCEVILSPIGYMIVKNERVK